MVKRSGEEDGGARSLLEPLGNTRHVNCLCLFNYHIIFNVTPFSLLLCRSWRLLAVMLLMAAGGRMLDKRGVDFSGGCHD